MQGHCTGQYKQIAVVFVFITSEQVDVFLEGGLQPNPHLNPSLRTFEVEMSCVPYNFHKPPVQSWNRKAKGHFSVGGG